MLTATADSLASDLVVASESVLYVWSVLVTASSADTATVTDETHGTIVLATNVNVGAPAALSCARPLAAHGGFRIAGTAASAATVFYTLQSDNVKACEGAGNLLMFGSPITVAKPATIYALFCNSQSGATTLSLTKTVDGSPVTAMDAMHVAPNGNVSLSFANGWAMPEGFELTSPGFCSAAIWYVLE